MIFFISSSSSISFSVSVSIILVIVGVVKVLKYNFYLWEVAIKAYYFKAPSFDMTLHFLFYFDINQSLW